MGIYGKWLGSFDLLIGLLSPSGFLTMHKLLTNLFYKLNTLQSALVLSLVFFWWYLGY